MDTTHRPRVPWGSSLEVSRRRFLRAAAGLAGGALTVSLASACLPSTPTAAPTRPAGVTSSGAGANAVYPTYLKVANGPKPDFPASGPDYNDGFNVFPTNAVNALPSEPPGTGGTVKIMSIALFPPPSPLDQNPAWQAVNKALNANIQFEIVTLGDYPVKLGTVMAGNDLPDILYSQARSRPTRPPAHPTR